ncbi:YqhG family protein [Paenibacillus sp. CN-4]|uniref:YqhG family protein n=1 Tax=Paenibacillus nanchangensis TaxID=3348343 RepID=UPI003978262A
MTLDARQVREQVLEYLEATECTILESSPHHVTVKLSPQADKMLTDRPYYWGFVERTGAPPETLSFTFVFDPAAYDAGQKEAPPRGASGNAPGVGNPARMPGGPAQAPGSLAGGQAGGAAGPGGLAGGLASTPGASAQGSDGPSPASGALAQGHSGPTPVPGGLPQGASSPAGSPPPPAQAAGAPAAPQDTILGRYFGIVPSLPRLGPGLIRREDVGYGSRRLRQIWSAAREEGRYLYLFEEPGREQRSAPLSAAYEPWLGLCCKIEFTCDLKREELRFLGVSLATGEVDERFKQRLGQRELIPRLPENMHVLPHALSLKQGADRLETTLAESLAGQDYGWAEQARKRLALELGIVDAYYQPLLEEPDEEKRAEIEAQYLRRKEEMTWQYEPKIAVTVVSCGLYHLR